MSAADIDRRFARGYAAVTVPMVASAAVAPSMTTWVVLWAIVGVVAVANRELRIRRRATRPAAPQLRVVADSGADSATRSAVQDRTAA